MAGNLIEGHECTLFLDYDSASGVLDKLSDEGKIEWMEQRVGRIFVDPIRTAIETDSLSPLMLGITYLALSQIIVLGWLITRHPSGCVQLREFTLFSRFIRKYMPVWARYIRNLSPKCVGPTLIHDLWFSYVLRFREHLSFGGMGVGVVFGGDRYKVESGRLQINPWALVHDLTLAVEQMFLDIGSNPRRRSIFLANFEEMRSGV